jgi:hypothetical protein
MTVIAASVNECRIAADRWCFNDDDTHHEMRKIHRIRGALVGFAGDLVDIEKAIAWMRAGSDPEKAPAGNVVALILNRSGLSTWTPIDGEIAVPSPYAVGSGGACARAAMAAGADVKRAVLIACEVHSQCGGGVSVYKLGRA